MEDAKRRAVEAIAQRNVVEVEIAKGAGGDACAPSKSDLGASEDLGAGSTNAEDVKDDEECSYQILRDRSVTRQNGEPKIHHKLAVSC